MISNVIFSQHKAFGPLSGKNLSFTTNRKPNKFIILYGKIGSGKTLFLNSFRTSLNFFNLYKNIFQEEKTISKKNLDYERKKWLIDYKCYCQFQIIGNKCSRKYWSFYPINLNLHHLYPGSTLSTSKYNGKRKEFKNFIHVNFSNCKKYNL